MTLLSHLHGDTPFIIGCCAFTAFLCIRWALIRLHLVLVDLYAAERAGEC